MGFLPSLSRLINSKPLNGAQEAKAAFAPFLYRELRQTRIGIRDGVAGEIGDPPFLIIENTDGGEMRG